MTGDETGRELATFKQIMRHINTWNEEQAGEFYDGVFLVDDTDEGFNAIAFGLQACMLYMAREVGALAETWGESMSDYIFDQADTEARIITDPMSDVAPLLERAHAIMALDVGPRRLYVFRDK